MKQKEKEYLVAFRLYIEQYDPRYRYPKWIKAINKTDAFDKYMAMIKPDLTLGACIVMDERPIKQDETQEKGKVNLLEKFFNAYHKGNLRLLEMMISQLDNLIDPTTPNHAPRPFIVDMDKINEQLCSTSKLASMLSSGVGHDMLPYNGYIYTDDFFEHVNDYMNTRYKYDLYDDYTLMRIRGDLQCMYNDYNRRGILPWETDKLEDATCGTSEVMKVSDFPAVVNREESEEDKTPAIKIIKQRTDEEVNMKENIVKGDRTKEQTSIDVLEYVPKFDIECTDIVSNFPYILEIDDPDNGVTKKHVVVITDITPNCIYYNYWANIIDDDGDEKLKETSMVLTPSDFNERNAKLYKITSEDLK